MTELHQANEHPLNQRALDLLKQVKAEVDPDSRERVVMKV